MIRRLFLCAGESFDPYYNLAVEQTLLENTQPGFCTLYLWQNRNTVVIGRNQNAYKECRTQLLEKEGGHLARRLSGGGAVYHDLGNLNFTFLVPERDFDLAKQLSVISGACAALGIPVTVSGRNDVLAAGRKISGNAFYRHGGCAYHHGTLLVNVDAQKMARYLCPSTAKLESKGVDSVQSRVANLIDFRPGLTCAELARRLIESFEAVYGLAARRLEVRALDQERLLALRARNASWEWLYGQKIPFTFHCEDRFAWGEWQLWLRVEHGFVLEARVYTDAMDWNLAPALERALVGCRFKAAELAEAVEKALGDTDKARDISSLLEKQNL